MLKVTRLGLMLLLWNTLTEPSKLSSTTIKLRTFYARKDAPKQDPKLFFGDDPIRWIPNDNDDPRLVGVEVIDQYSHFANMSGVSKSKTGVEITRTSPAVPQDLERPQRNDRSKPARKKDQTEPH